MPDIIQFSKGQLEQLKLAKAAGVETECLSHPEWGPMLMNVCWNREARKESTFPVHKAAAFLAEHFPMKGSMLCDDLYAILYAVRLFERGAIPKAPPKKADGSPDMPMFIFDIKREKLLAEGAFLLYSNRVSINNASWIDMPDIMAEGLEDALHIIEALQARAVIATRADGRKYEMQPGEERSLALLNIHLCLDDMNIRGYQIPYAFEYAGGSIETLYGLIHGNNPKQLCEYINMKSAQDYLAGDIDRCQIAVTSGASFCHDGLLSAFANTTLNMTPESAKEFARADVSPLTPDWSKMDIIGRIDMSQAIKIMAARGFQLIRKVDRKDRLDPDINVSDIVLYNPSTRDYIQASTCLDWDICYGGVHLYMHRIISDGDIRRTANWDCSCGPHRSQPGSYFEFTHHDGLFRAYDESLCLVPKHDFDWAKIGFDLFGIPVPVYFKMPILSQNEVWEQLGGETAYMMNDMGSYHFESLVNHILCLYDDTLQQSPSPHYRLYAQWVDNGGLFHAVGWLTGDSPQAMAICNAVFTWLHVPESVMAGFMAAGPQYMRSGEDQAAYKKLANKLSNNDTVGRDIVQAYELPDPKELPVKLPWLF